MHEQLRRVLIVAAVAVVLGQLADVLTTQIAINHFGLNEGNQLVAKVLDYAGFLALYPIKLLLGVLTALGIVWLWDRRHWLPMAGAVLIAVYANWALWHECAWWNIQQMAQVA